MGDFLIFLGFAALIGFVSGTLSFVVLSYFGLVGPEVELSEIREALADRPNDKEGEDDGE